MNLFSFQMIWASATIIGVIFHTIMQYSVITPIGVGCIFLDLFLYCLLLYLTPVIWPNEMIMDSVACSSVFNTGPLLTILLIVITSVFPVFAYQVIDRHWYPKPHHIVEELNFSGVPMGKRFRRPRLSSTDKGDEDGEMAKQLQAFDEIAATRA